MTVLKDRNTLLHYFIPLRTLIDREAEQVHVRTVLQMKKLILKDLSTSIIFLTTLQYFHLFPVYFFLWSEETFS